jgi:hypothetical protein
LNDGSLERVEHEIPTTASAIAVAGQTEVAKMSDQSNVEKGIGTAWPFVLPNVAETFQLEMRALLQEQAELLDQTQKIMAAWTKRPGGYRGELAYVPGDMWLQRRRRNDHRLW